VSDPLSVPPPLELLLDELDEPPSSPPPLELELLDVDPPLDDELLEDELEPPSGPPLDDDVASDTVASKVEPSAPDDPLLDDEVASDTVASKGVEPSPLDDPPLDDEDEPDTVASPDELPLLDPLLEEAPLEEAPLDEAASEVPCATLESPASGFSVVVTPPPHPEVMQAETATRAPSRACSGRSRKPFVRRTDMTLPPFKRPPSIGRSTINARPPRRKNGCAFEAESRAWLLAYFAYPSLSQLSLLVRLPLAACPLARLRCEPVRP
jgi:hypothetical protein